MPQPDAAASKVMHASMREVEAGLFSATYSGNADPRDGDWERNMDTHNGTDPQGVKFFVEELARGLGFSEVVWDELPAQLLAG